MKEKARGLGQSAERTHRPKLTDRRGLVEAPLEAFGASYPVRMRKVPNPVGT